MTNSVCITMPDKVYQDVIEKRKIDVEKWGWSHIFRVGYMRLNSVENQEENNAQLLAEKVEKVTKKLEKYAQKCSELEQNLAKLSQNSEKVSSNDKK
jgi:hypothetical protein